MNVAPRAAPSDSRSRGRRHLSSGLVRLQQHEANHCLAIRIPFFALVIEPSCVIARLARDILYLISVNARVPYFCCVNEASSRDRQCLCNCRPPSRKSTNYKDHVFVVLSQTAICVVGRRTHLVSHYGFSRRLTHRIHSNWRQQ